ncbi:hypothetical protein V6N12_076074 [Hibiscus sabdariffa]|uniref:Uncharacterized protein n=1 Tax=Hibiscus sabdariffa TaxID=183260 RepID=A0ABR2AY57_9ROSI
MAGSPQYQMLKVDSLCEQGLRSGPPVIGGDKTGADIRKISSSGRSVKQDGRAGSLLYLTLTNKKWSIRVPLLHCHIGSRCPCLIGKSRQSDSHCYR